MFEGRVIYCVLIVFISMAIELLWKGQTPYSISYKITPRDQMSALVLYASPLSTSGAI